MTLPLLYGLDLIVAPVQDRVTVYRNSVAYIPGRLSVMGRPTDIAYMIQRTARFDTLVLGFPDASRMANQEP